MQTKVLQNGVASIEFAFSFVILLALFYGIAGYAMPLLLSASYQQVASDALREGLTWRHNRQANDIDTISYVESLIQNTWMPDDWAQPCQDREEFLSIDAATGMWQVCLRHAAPNSIMPPIRLMDMEFPKLPDQIVGNAYMHTREEPTTPL